LLCDGQKRNAKDKDEEVSNCNSHCANGMGLVSLIGIDGLVERNIGNAKKWFEIEKSLGDSDAQYNYAM
jgi:TPR repeat protein